MNNKSGIPVGSKYQTQIKNKKVVWWIAGIILLSAVIVLILLLRPDKQKNRSQDNITDNTQILEPAFEKEGELYFLSQADTSKQKKISIEIADDEVSRNRGLMFRRTMADSVGMLFIFEDSRLRSFWMENTHISLDIIFVNEDMEIVNIQKNTVPFSKASIPSTGNAQFVIEVIAGFTENNDLKAGDKIRFIRNK